MLPWWSWVLIWGGCVVILVAVLAILGVQLFRKFEALSSELERFYDLIDAFEARAEELVTPYEPRPNAILRGPAAVAAEREELRRRIDARKLESRERRIAKGRRLVNDDPLKYAHLVRK